MEVLRGVQIFACVHCKAQKVSQPGKSHQPLCSVLFGEQARFFDGEIKPHLRHKRKGMLGMAAGGKNLNASQFYLTTGVELDSLDDRNTVFGEVRYLLNSFLS